MSGHTRFDDLVAEATIPARGIHSQTLSDEDGVTLVLFSFAPGEELSEHTSSRPAILHVLSGEADMTVGDDHFDGAAGTWVRMPSGTAHAIRAQTPLVLALYLLR